MSHFHTFQPTEIRDQCYKTEKTIVWDKIMLDELISRTLFCFKRSVYVILVPMSETNFVFGTLMLGTLN